jgi:hypothetical protein
MQGVLQQHPGGPTPRPVPAQGQRTPPLGPEYNDRRR